MPDKYSSKGDIFYVDYVFSNIRIYENPILMQLDVLMELGWNYWFGLHNEVAHDTRFEILLKFFSNYL